MEENTRPDMGQENNEAYVPPVEQMPTRRSVKKKILFALIAVVVAIALVVTGLFAGITFYTVQNEVSSTEEAVSAPNDTENTDIVPQQTEKGDKLTSVQVAQKLMPSVVGILIYQKDKNGKIVEHSSGSGAIMTEDGYIMTCSHVVQDGDITGYIEVYYTDGTTSRAKLIGYDTQTDIAVIKADRDGLTPAEFGDSDLLQVGEPVYVIGSPSSIEYLGSFAGGYVSAVDREITVGTQKFILACIQTDAAINPGNSGGPLINEYGQIIGSNSAKLVSTNVEGMGFAIPINTANSVVESILENGYVTGRPRIGITFTGIEADLAEIAGIPQGIRVVGISEECDVATKDVKIGDIITGIDGKRVIELAEIAAVINRKKPGDSVTLSIYRTDPDGTVKEFDVDVILSEMTE